MIRRLIPACALVVFLAGCGDDIYYSTRNLPTSSEDSWSPSQRWFWSEEREVYELPASPPAINVDHPGTRCAQPCQRIKAPPVGGMADTLPGGGGLPNPQIIARMDDTDGLQPLRPLKGEPIAGWHQETAPGAKEPLSLRPVGAYEDRPLSQPASGTDRARTPAMAATAEANVWCGDYSPPTSPLR